MAELAPHLLKYDYIEPSVFGKLALQRAAKDNKKLNSTPISTYIDNYYMTDAISRSSVTMAKCSTAFNLLKFDNFKKWFLKFIKPELLIFYISLNTSNWIKNIF